jgi:hypothetical protein
MSRYTFGIYLKPLPGARTVRISEIISLAGALTVVHLVSLLIDWVIRLGVVYYIPRGVTFAGELLATSTGTTVLGQ